jgi:hypothetical protein
VRDRGERERAPWMRPLDDRLLEVLQARGPLAPSGLRSLLVTTAGPTTRSAQEVEARLATLRRRGLVGRQGDRLAVTATGSAYLRGEVDAATLSPADDPDRR